jgi:WD40 repeat protein
VSTLRGYLPINCVAFSPDGKILAAGGGSLQAGNVGLYDPVTGDIMSTLTVDSGLEGVYSVSFSPMGDMIAVGCYNGKMHLLDTATAAVKRSLTGHSDP